MTQKDGDWTYYTGWIAAFALLAIFFVVCVFIGWFDQPWCGRDESGALCFRSWIEALGGWTTIPAAAIGAWYVIRQMKEAGKQHREMASIQLQRSRALVWLAVRDAVDALSLSAILWAAWSEFSPEKMSNFEAAIAFKKDTDELTERLNSSVFDDAEKDILAPSFSIITLRRRLRKTVGEPFEDEFVVDPLISYFRDKMGSIHQNIAGYEAELRKEAQLFFWRARTILGDENLQLPPEVIKRQGQADHIENAPSTAASGFSS
ncbi:hypothetical protein [Rhizobium rhizogenes]|uniref:hypothetical protein n=1 Tax=Rhizobium rhizogenes TaxID=359 RepID=UPI001572F351|nr:hypothetical protein [Rhizobium rhizogenes]NTF48504.1 hypothetical protein [Rhizobium rhizogenes]NTH05889.1 hypothetical protein [Rhizobium rhizogenes]